MCPPAENMQRAKPLNNIILITSLFINLSFLTLQAGLPTGTFKPWQIVQNVAAHQLQQSSHYPPFTACPIITETQEISLRTRLLCRLSELERVNCEYATSSVLTDWCGVPVYSLWDQMRWDERENGRFIEKASTLEKKNANMILMIISLSRMLHFCWYINYLQENLEIKV